RRRRHRRWNHVTMLSSSDNSRLVEGSNMHRLALPALVGLIGLASIANSADSPAPSKGVPASAVSWKKIALDTKFRSEGICIADVNHDGKKDLIVGDFWYEAADWKPHVLRPSKKPDGYDPLHYSDCMLCFAGDFN